MDDFFAYISIVYTYGCVYTTKESEWNQRGNGTESQKNDKYDSKKKKAKNGGRFNGMGVVALTLKDFFIHRYIIKHPMSCRQFRFSLNVKKRKFSFIIFINSRRSFANLFGCKTWYFVFIGFTFFLLLFWIEMNRSIVFFSFKFTIITFQVCLTVLCLFENRCNRIMFYLSNNVILWVNFLVVIYFTKKKKSSDTGNNKYWIVFGVWQRITKFQCDVMNIQHKLFCVECWEFSFKFIYLYVVPC